jgi:hypothetical protein
MPSALPGTMAEWMPAFAGMTRFAIPPVLKGDTGRLQL